MGTVVLKWVLQHQDQYDVQDLTAAAIDLISYGVLETLKWLNVHWPMTISNEALSVAVSSNQLDLAVRLNGQTRRYYDAPSYGCSSLPMINWLLSEYKWNDSQSKLTFIDRSLECTGEHNDIEIFKILWEQKRVWIC